jgi:Putative adhesin
VKPHPIPALVLAAAAASLARATCSGSTSSAHDQRTFNLSGTRLVINDTSSDLQVVPGNGPGIQVQRWLSGTAAKPGHSSWTLQGDTLQFSIDCSGLVFSCGSRFEVAVPPGTAVTASSGSNTVNVSGLSAPVTVNGNQGGVNVSGMSGPLQVTTGSGSVTATALRSAAVQVTTNQGSADISFAAAPRSVTVKCSTGNATVRVPTNGHQYHVLVSSGTGNASSKVPDDPQANSVVQVSSGSHDATVLATS